MVDNQIKRIYETKSKLGKETILRLLTDIVIKDLDDILEFDPNEYYYKDDLVHRFNTTTRKHEIYKCIVDNCRGDNFGDSTFWKEYTMGTGNDDSDSSTKSVWSINTIYQDNLIVDKDQDNLSIDVNISEMFDSKKDSIVVFSSLLGILDKSMYSVKTNGRTIEINKPVYKNETISYFIMISTNDTTGYNSFTHFSATIVEDNTYLINYADDGYNPEEDVLLVFSSRHNFIPNTCYDYISDSKNIQLKNGYTIDKGETVVIIRFRKVNAKTFKQLNVLTTDISDKDGNKILNNPFIYDSVMDIVLIFHSTLGIMSEDDYSIEYGKIFINNETFAVNKGEYLVVIAGTYDELFYIPDEVIDKSMFKQELRKNIDKLDTLPAVDWTIDRVVQGKHTINEDSDHYLLDVGISNIINPLNDSIILFSNIDGILDKSKYSIKPNGRIVDIFKRVYGGEIISYILLYSKNTDGGYNKIEHTVITVGDNTMQLGYPDSNYDSESDILLLFKSNKLIPSTDYVFNKETRTIEFKVNHNLKKNEIIIVTRFYKKHGFTFKNLLTISSEISTIDNLYDVCSPITYHPGDVVLIFHSKKGLMIPSNYFIEYGNIRILDHNYKLNIGEYLIIVHGKSGYTNKPHDEIIDFANMTPNLRNLLLKLSNTVTMSSVDTRNSRLMEENKNIRLKIDNPSCDIKLNIPLDNNNYNITTEVIDTDGDVGDIIITNKRNDSFTIEYTGISSYVDIAYKIN